ncbi:MAG: sugar phosphate isomerase/epimerase [Gemmataceae bacterium]|nr:sugar phosphate isomerase/epimerase [Gemmataceae bacterium]
MKSAVTVSLVPEARGGPFVYHGDLPAACREAKALGFDAIELFPPGPDAVDPKELRKLLDDNGLSLAAVGTGAGWVKHKLTLTDPDHVARAKAEDFVRAMIDFAGGFGAPAIIGSMQGRLAPGQHPFAATGSLHLALADLGRHAEQYHVPLLYEPLNRYETDIVNTLATGVGLVAAHGGRVKLLADLFHMNIEEANLADAIRAAGPHVGHVHFADSNRRAAGMGHTDFGPVVAALRDIGYAGYLSAEVFPLPDSGTAARQTIESFRRYTGQSNRARG